MQKSQAIKISQDDLKDGRIIKLLESHRQEMFKYSPPESVHALDIKTLFSANLTFWRAEVDGQFAACGALKELTLAHGELKSMKTYDAFLRKGVARALLLNIIEEAKKRGYKELSLETGAMAAFVPAQRLYLSLGFIECEPFSDYVKDVSSVCMSLELAV